MIFDKTVAAAVAETKSKFKLAEALATEIPPQRRGPKTGVTFTVTEYLIDAAAQITRAGGEERSWETLQDYRQVAIWISTEVGKNFRWIKGVSFSAHREACMAGLSYDEFVAMPKKTVDAIREYTAARNANRRGVRERSISKFELLTNLRDNHKTFDRISRAVFEDDISFDEAERDLLLQEIAWQRNALDLIESGIRAGSLGATIRALQEGAL